MATNFILLGIIFVALTEGYNTSVRQERNDEILSRDTLKIRYHSQRRVNSLVLKKISDTTLAGPFLSVWYFGNDGAWSEEHQPYMLPKSPPTFYHGVNSFSALTYFPSTGTLQGVIDEKYYVENLPLRLADNADRVDTFIRGIPDELGNVVNTRNKRGTDGKRKSAGGTECSPRKKFRGKDEKKKLYPEIFLAVDVTSKRLGPTIENLYEKAIMYVLAYWNAIDMLFRSLKRTDVRINIAGILMGKTQDLDTSGLVLPINIRMIDPRAYLSTKRALDDIGEYFYVSPMVERDCYDYLVWMTSATLLDEDVWHDGDEALRIMNKDYTGTSSTPTDCGRMRYDESGSHKISNRAIVMYDNEFAQYHTAARELAHLMFVPDDYSDVLHGDHQHSNCLPPNPTIQSSGIMDPANRRLEQYLYWSHCSEIHFERYSKSKSCCCLLNYPIRTYGMSDPPHHLTTKTQCECYKMEAFESNNYKATNCHEPMECKNRNGRSVEIGLPLDGTLCISDRQETETYCSHAECS